MCNRTIASGLVRRPWYALAVVYWLFVPAVLFAQAGATDVGEVAVFGGGGFGTGTHPAVGASSGIALSKWAMGLIEAAYMPMGGDTLRRQDNISSVQDSRLFDFNTSFHIRIPVRERWAPYGILGCGLVFNKFNAITGPNGALIGIDDFKFAFHTGAGLRYYIREDWGIRPEVKVIVSTRTYTRFTIGIFYNLPTNWP